MGRSQRAAALHRRKTFRHPVVGEVELSFEAVDLPTDDLWGLNLTIYTPEAATPAEDRIKLLASWAASEDTESSNRTANHDGTRMHR